MAPTPAHLPRPARPLPALWPLAAIALAPLLMAALGLSHPADLTPATATHWLTLHLILIPLFPLIGVNLWWLVSGRRGLLPTLARVGAFIYAVYYPAVDLLAGIGTGRLLELGLDRHAAPVVALFAQGNALGTVGNVGLLVSCVSVCVALWRGAGRAWWIGTPSLLVGAALFTQHHIYRPWGVLGMLLLALGFIALWWAQSSGPGRSSSPPGAPSPPN